ncbi:MAG: hypothetical protein WD009_00840 [Phycisphaeraceae bacterium]
MPDFMCRRSRLPVCVVVGAIAAVLLTAASPLRAQSFTAQQFYNGALANGNLNQEPGELWAWHARYSMGQFMQGYHAYGDTSWLDYGVQYYDWVLGHARTGPDGYMGWIGPLPGGAGRTDEHIGDALLTQHMLDFAEVVRNDPVLYAQYGAKADAYVEFTRVHLFEKWDARDTYHRFGDFGAYSWWEYELASDLPDYTGSQWIPNTDRISKSGSVTQQFNKQTAMAVNALRLWRITGEEQYRERAFELYGFLKSRMQLYDGAYVWNFREPAIDRDIRPDNTVMTWIAVHPNSSGYQATEVTDLVEAYHSGIVFDEQDIARLVSTNMDVMWTGSGYNGPDAAIKGTNGNAGTLWRALADFSQAIRNRFGGPGGSIRDRIIYDHFVNVTSAEPPSLDRKYVGDDDPLYLLDWPHSESRSLNLAFLTNPVFTPGEDSTWIGVKSLRSGTLQVAVYDEAGEDLLLVLANRAHNGNMGGRGGDYVFDWDGTDLFGEPLDPGNYRIRWTLSINSFGDDGYREYPITLVPEPTTATVLGVTLGLLLRRRPRR